MKKYIFAMAVLSISVFSCSDKDELLAPYTNDITLNELSIERFSHVVPNGGFSSGDVVFNTKGSGRTFSGFCYSNRSNRSFLWSDAPVAIDSNRFSVYTVRPNLTQVYAVAHASGDDCFFTLKKPRVVEHILIAPTTETYLGLYYGPNSGATPIANPGVPSAPKAIWQTYIQGLERKFSLDGDYFKVIIKGYRNNSQTGTVQFFLCCRKTSDSANPAHSYLRNDWLKADLTSLGEVDKVMFYIDCSMKGVDDKSIIPPYFCVDGIRLK